MYKAIKSFTDLQDNNYKYHTGDTFPRDGYEVSAERLHELLTDANRRHTPMIVEILPENEEIEVEVEKIPKTEKKPRKRANKKG